MTVAHPPKIVAVGEGKRNFDRIGDGSVNGNAIGRAGDLVHPDTRVDAVACETEVEEGVWRYRRQMLGIEHGPCASTVAAAGQWAGMVAWEYGIRLKRKDGHVDAPIHAGGFEVKTKVKERLLLRGCSNWRVATGRGQRVVRGDGSYREPVD